MKKHFFLFAFLAICMALKPDIARAQYAGYLNDTLKSSSSIDTVILYPGGTTAKGALTATAAKAFSVPGQLSMVIRTDSLSGSTNATIRLQVCTAYDPLTWISVPLDNATTFASDALSQTLNGATAQYFAPKGDDLHLGWMDFPFLKWRILAITASGTQNTRIRVDWRFKPEK